MKNVNHLSNRSADMKKAESPILATRLSRSSCLERTRGFPSPPCDGFGFSAQDQPLQVSLVRYNLIFLQIPEKQKIGNIKGVIGDWLFLVSTLFGKYRLVEKYFCEHKGVKAHRHKGT